MPIELDHLIVPSRNRRAAAELLASILGVPWSENGVGPFCHVFVGEGLTLDIDQVDGELPVMHYCFRLDDQAFTDLVARLESQGLPYRSLPHGPVDRRINEAHGGRIVYWSEPDGHVWEALTVSYARRPRPVVSTDPAPRKQPMPLVDPGPIETERVTVRLVAETDLPSLLEVNGDEEATAMLPYATWRSLDDGRAWLDRMAAIQATGLALQFVVVAKASGNAIGTCLLFRFDEGSARAELGYVLGRAHWGRGLMREALSALIDRAFASMGLRRLEAEVDTRNAASAHLLTRLGFSREGLMRQRWITKGEARDVAMYGLLRTDWPRV